MAYNSVDILRDFASNPVPQFYDPSGNTYDPLTGTSFGNGRYGSDSLSWGKTSGGLFAPIQVDSSGVVQTANNGAPLTPVVVMQNAANVNGNGTTLTTSGYGTAMLSIVFSTSPAWSGTVNFEAQGPDGNWYPINGRLRGGSNAPSTTITGGTGLYSLNVRGVQSIRARVSGYATGSVTVTGQAQATPSSDADEIANVSLSGSNVTNVTLANAVTTTGVQPSVSVGNNKTLRIETYGTATSFAVTLQGIGESGAAYALTGTNLNGLSNAQSITSAGLFQYDVTGLVSVEANVTAVTGGSLSVTGKLVAS